MKILLVAHLRRRLGPDITASRSRVIYQLAKGLIQKGHQVSILGPGSSKVEGATIIPVIPAAINETPPFENQFYAEISFLVAMARKIQEIAPDFDIIHNHTYPEYINLLVEGTLPTPMVTTIHAPVNPELQNLLAHFPKANIVAQSKAYQKLVTTMHIPWVVHNGININLFEYSDQPRDYLLWIGRLGGAKNPDGSFMDYKGVRDAIQATIKADQKLFLVGNVEDQKFFDQEVKPYLSEKIQWISPISKEQTHSQEDLVKLLHQAKALIFSTHFEESFGLIAPESMATGTPVIGYANGSLPDIIDDGKTGFLVNQKENDLRGDWKTKETGIDGLAKAIETLYSLPNEEYKKMQQDSRERVEKYFTLETMVNNYEALYQKLSKKS